MSGATYPEIAGSVAVVTGAARGMGSAFAEGLAQRGANVIAADIDAGTLKSTTERISGVIGGGGGTVVAMHLDVTKHEDHTAVAEHAVERFGRLDHWINSAGVFPEADVLDITADQFSSTMAVNVHGVLFGSQAAARAMEEKGGSIVNIASVAALRVRPGRASYSTSKAAVDHLTRSLAVELGPRGVRVNAIAPGFVDTDMVRWVHEVPGALEKVLATIPIGRLGQPEDILDAVLFLLSNSARYVTGSTLVVDGGSSHGR